MHQRDKSDSITLTKQVELISSLSQSLRVFCHNPNVLLHLPWGILTLPTIKEKTREQYDMLKWNAKIS